MLKCFSFIILISVFTIMASAQPKKNASLSGRLIDGLTKEALIGAIISSEEFGNYAISDNNGTWQMTDLPLGRHTLIISYVGFDDYHLSPVILQHHQQLDLGNVEINSSPIKLSSITVTPGSYSIKGDNNLSKQTMNRQQIENMSWAEDITRTVTRLPGIASNDFSSKFVIRGGESDEVLMLLDGMELYEPFHQRDFVGGLSSIVDEKIVQSLELNTGGFAAEYGQRQSGVFSMQSTLVKDNETKTTAGLSLLNVSASRASSFANNKFKYVISARRSVLDLVLNAIGEVETIPTYFDAFGKIEYKLNDKNSFSFHTLIAGDNTKVRDEKPLNYDRNDTKYENYYGWVTHKWLPTQSLYARSMLYGGDISQRRDGLFFKRDYTDKGEFFLKDDRSFNFIGIKQDWIVDVSHRLAIKAGFDYRHLKASYDYDFALSEVRVSPTEILYNFSDSFASTAAPKSDLSSAYISAKSRITDHLILEAGLRYDVATHSSDKLWSPRIALAYALTDKTSFRAACGQYYQSPFINNLQVNYQVNQFDEADLAVHYVAGVEHQFNNKLYVKIEAYFKDYQKLSRGYRNLRDPYEVFPEQRNDLLILDFDGGTAKGIEVMVKYDIGDKLSWWFSYTTAKAIENVTNIEYDGIFIEQLGEIAKPLNQNHTIYTDFIYRLNEKWRFSLSWQYYIGLPLTTYEYGWQRLSQDDPRAQQTLEILSEGDLQFYNKHSTYNGDHFPAYHRMDVRINRTFKTKKGKLSSFLHIINAYNQFNMRKFDLGVEGGDEQVVPDGQGGYVVTEDHPGWFSILPFFGISWEF